MVGVGLGLSLTAILLIVPSALPPRSRKTQDEEGALREDSARPQRAEPDTEKLAALAEAMIVLGLVKPKTRKRQVGETTPGLLVHNGLSARLPKRRKG